MKDIKDQRTSLDQRNPSPFGKLLEFFKFKKSILDSQEEGGSKGKELKIEWEDKVLQKKLEIDEAKKAWEEKRKETLNQSEPVDTSQLNSEQSQAEVLDSSQLNSEQSQAEVLDSIAQDSELSNQISGNALSPSIFKQSSKQADQKEE